MRTTMTIDDDLMAELKERAHRTGQPLKQVVNQALRAGLAERRRPDASPVRVTTYAMGHPQIVNLDKALAIAARLEDEEIARELAVRK